MAVAAELKGSRLPWKIHEAKRKENGQREILMPNLLSGGKPSPKFCNAPLNSLSMAQCTHLSLHQNFVRERFLSLFITPQHRQQQEQRKRRTKIDKNHDDKYFSTTTTTTTTTTKTTTTHESSILTLYSGTSRDGLLL